MTALQALAEYCNFGKTLEVMLQDRIVCRVSNAQIQNRLLSETTLTYQRVLEHTKPGGSTPEPQGAAEGFKAPTMQEESDKPPVVLKSPAGQGTGFSGNITCYRCGKEGHVALKCKDSVCHKFGKKGYLKSVSRSEPKKLPPWKVNEIEGGKELKKYLLFYVDSLDKTRPLKVAVEMDSQRLSMELDTGAAYSLVSGVTFKEFWPDSICNISKHTILFWRFYTCGWAQGGRGKVQSHFAKLSFIVEKGVGPTLWEKLVI